MTARSRVYAALGDPARLAVVDRLVWGDVSPGELADHLGMASNLVAHHVSVLVRAGVVRRVRSHADRRRTYLRLVPDPVAELVPAVVRRARRVVFVCTGNSARSPLAAAIWAGAGRVPAASAGTRPADRVHRRAVTLARRHGLTLASGPAHLGSVLRAGDLVVAVCDDAHEQMGDVAPDRLHWSVPDPVAADTNQAFENAYADLSGRIARLAPAVEALRGRDRHEPT